MDGSSHASNGSGSKPELPAHAANGSGSLPSPRPDQQQQQQQHDGGLLPNLPSPSARPNTSRPAGRQLPVAAAEDRNVGVVARDAADTGMAARMGSMAAPLDGTTARVGEAIGVAEMGTGAVAMDRT